MTHHARKIEARGVIPFAKRASMFLNSYRLKILLKDGNVARIGRGSFGTIKRLEHVTGGTSSVPVLEVGNYCEVAAHTKVLIGGEHRNDRVFNNSLSAFEGLRSLFKDQGETSWLGFSAKPTLIGHAVILSLGTTVVQGAHIGTGAVIGAGSVVTRTPVPPFSLAGGAPARMIRARLSESQREIAEELQWWSWDVTTLVTHMRFIIDMEKNVEHLRKVKKIDQTDTELVLDLRQPSQQMGILDQLIGYESNGKFAPLAQAAPAIRNYFSQLNFPENQPLTWVPDIFALAGKSG